MKSVEVKCRRWRVGGLVFLVIGLYTTARPAFERLPEGGRAAAMGGVAVAVAKDPWALWANPSLAAEMSEWSLSLAHSPSWLGIPELSRSTFVYVQPTTIGTFGIAGNRFGLSMYRESVLSLMFAAGFDQRFQAGCGFTFYHLSIERYGTGWTLGVDAGCTCPLTAEVTLGVSVLNLNAPTIGVVKEKLPQSISIGVLYQPFAAIAVGADLIKEASFPTEVHLGIAYQILDCLSLRGGASDEPSTYTAGVGISCSFFALEYGFTAHADLGFTHHFSLTLYPDLL